MRQPILLVIALSAACSAPDPGINGAVGRRIAPSSGDDTQQAPAPSTPSSSQPPSNPTPPPPPPPPPPDAGSDVDAASPPTQNNCGTPRCGADTTNGGCGCIAAAPGTTTTYFLGCTDQGCVCGQGQTVTQQLATTGACDSEAAMMAAWAQCTCP